MELCARCRGTQNEAQLCFHGAHVKSGHQELLVMAMSVPARASRVTVALCLCTLFVGVWEGWLWRWSAKTTEASHWISPSPASSGVEWGTGAHVKCWIPGTPHASCNDRTTFSMNWRIHRVRIPVPLILLTAWRCQGPRFCMVLAQRLRLKETWVCACACVFAHTHAAAPKPSGEAL